MRRNARCPRLSSPPPRRGNSIVLVMGILVLLVIIATAFITRTQAGRVTSSVTVRSMLRDDNARAISEMLAHEVSMALFPRPVNDDPVNGDPEVLANRVADSNFPRLSPLRNPSRYGVDQDNDGPDGIPFSFDDDGFPDYPYNFAPYQVVAFTNWPDPILADPTTYNWPLNPGGVVGQDILQLLGVGEGNPIGNPGFGDFRPLADHEPLRWITNGNGVAFSHWRHMTNIAHANNGFRICRDISDVNGAGLVTDLSIPVEQWLAIRPFNLDPVTGDSVYPGDDYIIQWSNWFSSSYSDMYTNNADDGPLNVPANFYNLSNLDGGLDQDGDGDFMDVGERPQDEFIRDSARWNVNLVLVDTDGDGFTDSFWFLAPTMTERGIRQIVAVRIVDNSAMLNVNVATRFNRLNTTGATPSDFQLVGDITEGTYPGGLDVGYFDNPANSEFNFPGYTGIPLPDEFGSPYNEAVVEWRVIRWDNDGERDFLSEIGVDDHPDFTIDFELGTAGERLLYWQLSGLRPFSATGGLTPFTLADELELRMSYGQNYPWIISRFERAVNTTGNLYAFLRSSIGREESSEYLDQCGNRELAFDHRRNLTMYSGARNDEMPPWLWWRWEVPDDVVQEAMNNPTEPIIDRFLAQSRRKLDLREEVNPFLFLGERDFAYRLPRTLMLALTDGDQTNGNSYFGDYDPMTPINALTHARRLAAGLAANIIEFRDADSDYGFVQNSSVPLPQVGSYDQVLTQRFLGVEKQPFLVEALIGHVYKSDYTVVPPDAYTNSGNHMIYEGSPQSTIVVVQIANPFDEVLNLNDFRLRVFPEAGDAHEVDFSTLPSPSIGPGEARTYYAIKNELDGDPFQNPWVNVLQLDATFSHKVDATDPLSDISNDRSVYDSGDEKRAIELVRIMGSNANGNIGNVSVLIDRIDISAPTEEDDFAFGEAVEDLADTEPVPFPDLTQIPPPFDNPLQTFPGLDIGDDTYWIQWVHVSRDWDVNFNGNQGIQADERNPRYVFAAREVDSGDDSFSVATTDDGDVVFTEFGDSDKFHFHEKLKDANTGVSLNFSMQMLQKDADFEQVGELLNVWMFGHLLKFEPGTIDSAYVETTQTFSEFMIDEARVGDDVRVNRLRLVPDATGGGGPGVGQGDMQGAVIGIGDPNNILDRRHAVPALPAAARVLDAFVCDDRGLNGTVGVDEYLNANGFTGKTTPGLININTAGLTVLRSAPHMTRLVHEIDSPSNNPFVRVPEAIVRYRERFRDPSDTLPDYGDRGDDTFIEDLRGERGFASLGELMLLLRPASFAPEPALEPNENWQVDFAGQGPFVIGNDVQSTQISTDVNDLPGNDPDLVAQDSEELNLLFAGMSNMITTRSDVFTVYFRVRSFIQNPTTGVWDATNLEFIVDDSRYVMLVDRSEVNHPNDKPKILYLEKLPK